MDSSRIREIWRILEDGEEHNAQEVAAILLDRGVLKPESCVAKWNSEYRYDANSGRHYMSSRTSLQEKVWNGATRILTSDLRNMWVRHERIKRVRHGWYQMDKALMPYSPFEESPGLYLKRELKSRGLSLKEFGEKTGMRQWYISDCLNGHPRRPITPEIAAAAQVFTQVPMEYWLGLEKLYGEVKDLPQVQRKDEADIPAEAGV